MAKPSWTAQVFSLEQLVHNSRELSTPGTPFPISLRKTGRPFSGLAPRSTQGQDSSLPLGFHKQWAKATGDWRAHMPS